MRYMKTIIFAVALVGAGAYAIATTRDEVQKSRYHLLADMPFVSGYIARDHVPALLDESFFQRGVQTYLWAVPALNMYAMKEGSEKIFGRGYNVLPVWKQRLNAKTLITTPNSDVIYALGYLATWGCPARTEGRAADIWCCRRITAVTSRRGTSPSAQAHTGCSSSGAASSRIRTNSPNPCG